MMSLVNPDDFEKFFEELWGCKPFPWQRRLADTVYKEGWPDFIDLPTASGKTACLDIAVFVLALQTALDPARRTAGRRIFFVVNRRIIVDEAYERALKMAQKLRAAEPGTVLRKVAQALREVSGDPDAPPLDVAILRGGIVRDNRWARSITQPTIITSTVDQVGSRLLFRGYGVSDAAKPLHAALVAHDSLILLDEAHISQPFVETLEAVTRYRGEAWSETEIQTPFHFVRMTATSGKSNGSLLRLEQDDRAHPVLRARHSAVKPVRLYVAERAKGKRAIEELAEELAEQAVALVSERRRNIAVVVNRIATARAVADLLSERLKATKLPSDSVHLMIGRMRPIDRDTLTRTLRERLGAEATDAPNAPPMFVVATQCLEVGADLDFDAMVSECASLDALRQRFGRLNRRGRAIDACGAIVIRTDQVDAKDDPVYGASLSETWQWLKTVAEHSKTDTVDFGIHAMDRELLGKDIEPLIAPRAHAPVLFPAYLDAWVQTCPAPTPDPDVSLFLHGPQRSEPEVQVCWRNDLESGSEGHWVEIVSLCPPTSPECMNVPIGVVRKWLMQQPLEDDARSDSLDARVPEPDEDTRSLTRRAVVWRGPDQSFLLESSQELRPGDTIVLPATVQGWEVFGHKPEHAKPDVAEEAFRTSRGLTLLRLRPGDLDDWPQEEAVDELREWLTDQECDLRIPRLRELLAAVAESAPEAEQKRAAAMRALVTRENGVIYSRYPDGKGVVLRTRRPEKVAFAIPLMDDGDDESSRMVRTERVPLDEHLAHVLAEVDACLARLPLFPCSEALRCAAALHDWGKADDRFQALLVDGDRDDAWAQPRLWAKSGSIAMSAVQRRAALRRSELPTGFRHEMLSLQLAEQAADRLPADEDLRELALHLVAAHHGYARPFAPVVLDDDPPEVDLSSLGIEVRITAERRKEMPPHRLDSGVAERFWARTRRYGWWGLAYLEAVVRLADQRASQKEDEQEYEESEAQSYSEATE